MLQVARLAPRLLDDASGLVRDFVLDHLAADGGFEGRDGRSDLYYTVFGIESLIALAGRESLGIVLPEARIAAYLSTFGDGAGLDLVHLASLARAWAGLRMTPVPEAPRRAMLSRLDAFRAAGGGYHGTRGSETGTVYGAFLALGAYQDLGGELPDPRGLAAFVRGMETEDGAYANDRALRVGSTNATAAAVTVLRHLGEPPHAGVADWLEARCRRDGGFVAAPGTPLPDLLSTATALHALAGLERSFASLKEPCLDFVDSLWTGRGSFHATWADDDLDCEYTYYGLLALGHLSL
jgi:prenyltransferase beta subunit